MFSFLRKGTTQTVEGSKHKQDWTWFVVVVVDAVLWTHMDSFLSLKALADRNELFRKFTHSDQVRRIS